MRLREEELEGLCALMRARLPQGGVIVLQGDLASGKTSLVKAFARGLHVSDTVTSPTFSLQQCYGGELYHYDLYNHGLGHFLSLGMLEELEKPGYHLIEWGDEALLALLDQAGLAHLRVRIEKCASDLRCYEVSDA